jgi:hypothetical protein
MSRILSELLEAKEPLFTLAIHDLEAASGRHNVDIRLTAEITEKIQRKIRELGLDPHDTNGKELYYALFHLTKLHDTHLAKRIGGKDPADVADMLPRIKETIESLKLPKTCWALKASVAKRMLTQHPPKKIMRRLGYRSVESMLKRENVAEIYGALRFAESNTWMKKFLEMYKKLTPMDFESRQIKIIMMDKERWSSLAEGFVHKKRHNITHLKEMGVILMLPMPIKKMPGITITALPILIHYINEIRLYSAYFKLQQVKPNFGDIIMETIVADPGHAAVMAGQHIHWRVIQRYFGKLENEYHPEMFEPHVQPEDLHWRKAEEVLYRLEPSLKFWEDMDYVGVLHDARPVTLNLMDMAISYVNVLPYGKQAVYHFRESLWNEIFTRYLGHKVLEEQVLKQLDNEMITPEDLDQPSMAEFANV